MNDTVMQPAPSRRRAGRRRPQPDACFRELGTVPVEALRLARLAVGVLYLGTGGRDLLFGSSRNEALLRLLLPVLDPASLLAWAERNAAILEDDTIQGLVRLRDGGMFDWTDMDSDDARTLLKQVVKRGPGALRRHLAEADHSGPVSPTVQALVDALQLDPTEQQILDFLALHYHSDALRQLLRTRPDVSARANRECLGELLEVDSRALAAALQGKAPLRALGLLDYREHSDLEDFIRPSSLLRHVFDTECLDSESLLSLLIEPVPAADWALADFPHLRAAADHLSEALAQASAGDVPGINVLLYGPPGTGKTGFARALVAESGLRGYLVRSSDEDGEGLSRRGRLSAFLLAQRLLARVGGSVLLFDEVEDVFETRSGPFGWMPPGPEHRQKGWMNRTLEENPVPAIWLTNETRGMDPAFLRRFLLPLAFRTPPWSVRRQMVGHHLGSSGVSRDLLDALARDHQLTPAQFGAASRVNRLLNRADPDAVVSHTIQSQRLLLLGQAEPAQRSPATEFDADFLNLGGICTPAVILEALERHGRGSLCFYGLPGTGKTQFAEVLADALDRELVARSASDLVSPYVGETERNLAALFAQVDPVHSVILLDEVDSFLSNRAEARRQWERTQVNELLQQMERYPGIFIAATNRIDGIDPAALRRFDFKLEFRPLSLQQRLRLFAREALGNPDAAVPDVIAHGLETLESLTLGDVANVCRQRHLLGADWSPAQFLAQLDAECRLKQQDPDAR